MIPNQHQSFINSTIEITKQDQRLAGLAIGGSYLTDELDEFSDLDFVIAIYPEFYDEVMDSRQQIAENLGDLLACFTGEHVNEPRLLICLYGPQPLHVDLKFVALADFSQRIENPAILWERDNCLTDIIENSAANFPPSDLQWIEDRFWIWVHYGAAKIGRGELFETISFLDYLRQFVLGPLLLKKNGHLPRGLRKIEWDATEEFEELKKTIPEYDKSSCVNALKATIDLYEDMRDSMKTDGFNQNLRVEEVAKNYLEGIRNQA